MSPVRMLSPFQFTRVGARGSQRYAVRHGSQALGSVTRLADGAWLAVADSTLRITAMTGSFRTRERAAEHLWDEHHAMVRIGRL
jgi:hypothetical protein